MNLKWLAEYCGTSVAMIEQSYGRYLETEASRQSALLAGTPALQPSTLAAGLTVGQPKFSSVQASLTVPSWNQIHAWLREMDLLRKAEAA